MSHGDLLQELRVVEYSRDVPAAACAREFARWGAEVLTFEAPDSLLHEPLVVGKALRSGDWRSELTTADVFVTDAPLADLDDVAERFPRLVVHSSPFGSDGPYASFLADDLVVQALAGFMGTNGLTGREPLASPAAITPRAVGVLGTVAALLVRMHSGQGEWIELSSHEACSTLTMSLRSELSDEPLPRVGGTPGWAEVMQTAKGYITLSPWSKGRCAARRSLAASRRQTSCWRARRDSQNANRRGIRVTDR